MKRKHILLTTAIAIVLSGCGDKTELTPQEKIEILKRDAEQKQKAKESYMFSSFKRTEGSGWFPDFDYTLIDESTKEPLSIKTHREDGCIITPYKGWPVEYDSPQVVSRWSLEWSDYKEKGEYSRVYLALVDTLARQLRLAGFDVSDHSGKEYRFYVRASSRVSMIVPQKQPLEFSTLLTSMLLRDAVPGNDLQHYLVNLGYVRTLIGVKYRNKALTLVGDGDQNTPRLVLADDFRKRDYYHSFPTKIDSDIPVTQEQIDEWNQVFIDVLKEDPFFGQQMNTPADLSGRVSTLAALKGTTGVNATGFTMNGVTGAQIDFGLPVYVQLAGDVDQSKTTEGVTGLVAYRFGNTAIGAIQSYANASNAHHTETSVVTAQSLGNMYIEGQLGTISVKGGSGMRSQVRLGVDTSYGMPFVQLTHRDFGSTTDAAAYVGFELANAEFKADTYAFSTTLLTRVGHHSAQGVTGSVDLNAALNLKSGVGFNASLSIGSTVESKAAFNMSIDR